MKKYFLVLTFLFLSLYIYSQNERTVNYKGVIDSEAINNWPRLSNEPIISNDGDYVSYIIYNKPAGNHTLIIQSTNDSWQMEIVSAFPAGFSSDSKQFIASRKDTILLISLDVSNKVSYIKGVYSWKYSNSGGIEWLAWQLSEQPNDLIVINLITDTKKIFHNVNGYDFDGQGKSLLVNGTANSLIWVNLIKASETIIWPANDSLNDVRSIAGYTFDKEGNQLAFIVQNSGIPNSINKSLWYYKTGMEKAVMKVNSQSVGMEPGLYIMPVVRFSGDGRYIFTTLQRPPGPTRPAGGVQLDLWSYKDTILQSSQANEGKLMDPGQYPAVVPVSDNRIIRLCTNIGDFIKLYPTINGDYVLVGNNTAGDRFWLKQEDMNWLVSLKDGSRELLTIKGGNRFSFSPEGKFLVYYDYKYHHYFSHNLKTGKIVNITALLTTGTMEKHFMYYHAFNRSDAVGIANWGEGDKFLLVYDDYDIWQLDPTGKGRPENVTNGYGRKFKIVFRLMENGPLKKQTLLFTAFNLSNKENGFYQKTIGEKGDPHMQTMGPFTYYHSGITGPEFTQNMIPVKAAQSDKWIVKRESAMESPNLFLTSDFKNFKPLTNCTPEVAFNWLKAQLITWVQPDGFKTQGVLYKPENFDPKKKYPVLFIIYEQLSDRLNEYPLPAYTGSNINIPWFVSRGYFVFTPDIHFTKGRRGASALTTVISGARALSKFPFIDTQRMAVIGHSLSGLMINYIVTHSNFFAAAITGSGTSDEISSTLQLNGYGFKKRNSRLENAEDRMGATLWERPDLYIAESPILKASKVTTPLILFHSMTDGLPWEQSLEMFIALRRNGKKAWLLQYDIAGHVAFGKDAEDYTIRITQYFDHYLKGKPAPRWMTSGIKADQRGIDTGYDIDPNGTCGENCKICNSLLNSKSPKYSDNTN